ncbi:MAG: helix-turn-helix domain-containing protein [Gammaproteobacteria bacterium]|jgi:transcriptional regulator GlxA family with amidase domain|nr:helix-turn-helix domain-containing protein [Gammaproteobacteria bacterium]MDP6166781.1 helix-turn-helix domain-containing protein [Gammaproteobacteria bacterium]
MDNTLVINIDFIIDNNFSMLELSGIMEPINLAYVELNNAQVRFNIYSNDGLPKTSNCGTTLPTKLIGSASIPNPDIIFVLSTSQPPKGTSCMVVQRTRKLKQNGCTIVGVGEGIQWLYDNDLIDQSFISSDIIEKAPNGAVNIKRGTLYSMRNNTVLCAGESACLDMSLKLISTLHSKKVSISTAERLSCPIIRSSKHHKYETQTYTHIWPDELKDACQLMNNNLKEPLRITEICEHLGITLYHLHLLFKKYIGIPPNKYYYDLRIMRVQALLSETDLSIREIALETGYTNISTLYKRFKQRFGTPPCHFKKSSAF